MSSSEIQRHCERTWDTIIIGAGVAGSACAILAAQAGLKVLLVESKRFPREKVCGGCLNHRAQLSLQRLGLLADIRRAGSIDLSEIHLQMDSATYRWPIPNLTSVRRSTLDALMVERANACGATFLEGTYASLEAEAPARLSSFDDDCSVVHVRLKPTQSSDGDSEAKQQSNIASARTVIVAAGLTRSPLKPIDQWPTWVDPESRIGVQAIVDFDSIVEQCEDLRSLLEPSRRCLHMLASKHGYVGICFTDGNNVDFASAIDPHVVSDTKSIPRAVSQILSDCGLRDTEFLMRCQWMATPALTRVSARVASKGVYVVGDSLGYVEPFTGEGMSWALENAEILVPLLVRDVRDPNFRGASKKAWEDYVASHRRVRQRVCHWVAKQARHPTRAKWVLKAFDWIPPLRNRVMKDAVQ
jgi:2-polyprenyl-6-methoxyphenol hydroxylase-like FAD-dependent oxidoreductase